MSSRALRSRIGKANQENVELSAGEENTRLGSREHTEGMGSVGEPIVESIPSTSESKQKPQKPSSQPSEKQPVLKETVDIQELLAGVMAVVQQSQESLKADLAASNEILKESVKAEISSVRADLAANQESVKGEFIKIRKDIQSEHEILISRFECQNQQTKKELSGKLETESKRLTNLVTQMQRENESELLGVKRQLQTINSDIEAKLQQTNNTTQALVEELANQVDEQQSEVSNKIQKLDQEIDTRLERQKESINQALIEQNFAQVNAKIVGFENRVLEQPRTEVVNEPLTNGVNLQSPSVVDHNALQQTSDPTDENRTCSCQTINCEVCMHNNVSTYRVNVADSQQVSSFLSASELPLPQFNETKDTNPVLHIRQLDEFMRFRGVPKALQLAVAYRSMTGQMTRHWVETARGRLKDYQEFRHEFIKVWWSSSRQSLEKCKLYQGKYTRSSGLSISAYFLKHATTASYLEPKPSDTEIIEALRYHFPIQIQRAMLSNQLDSISETLDLLKRVEVMEASEGYQRPHNQAPQIHPNAQRQNQAGPHDRRAQTQGHARQVQFGNPRNRNNGNWRRRNRNYEERNPRLNPDAPTFQTNQHQEVNSGN
jgi:hypothetical protein